MESQYFIGVDFGTVHTKVCVRDAIEQQPAPVVVDPSKSGLERYLLPSVPSDWKHDLPPKVLLCGRQELDSRVENEALHAAAQPVSRAIAAAVNQVDESDPGEKTFILQLGFPTEKGVMVEGARARYGLVAEQALALVADNRVHFQTLFDERLASLALLRLAKIRFTNQPLLVVDGGGWTTHVSLIRWSADDDGAAISIHGDHTALHGVRDVVQTVATQLKQSSSEALSTLSLAIAAAYRATSPNDLNLEGSALSHAPRVFARERSVPEDRARSEFNTCITTVRKFAGATALKESWETAWQGGYTASPSPRHFQNYWLVLAGGAARLGRPPEAQGLDPLAISLSRWQQARGITFERVVYPELDESFWTFNPKPPQEVVPYLFVAGGYTFPFSDWPRELRRRAVELQPFLRERQLCSCGGISGSCDFCVAGIRKPNEGSGVRLETVRPRQVTGLRPIEAEVLCEICLDVIPSAQAIEHFNGHECSVCRQHVVNKREHLRADHGWSRCAECGALTPNIETHRKRKHGPSTQAVPRLQTPPPKLVGAAASKPALPGPPARSPKASARGPSRTPPKFTSKAEDDELWASELANLGPKRVAAPVKTKRPETPRPPVKGPLKHNALAAALNRKKTK